MPKRLFDILFAAILLIIVSPILLLVAIGVLLADGRPVLYRSARVGLNGRLFDMHKFRSMRVRDRVGSKISGGDDPRVFPFGRIIRSLKLDELPQLWDILRGEMSVVGPRPEDPSIVEQHYTAEYHRSLAVRPGLTSPGSLYYYTHLERSLLHESAEIDYVQRVLPEKMRLDLDYVQKNNVFRDIGIVFQTVAVIVRQSFSGRT